MVAVNFCGSRYCSKKLRKCSKSAVFLSTDSTTYTGEEQSPQRGIDNVQDLVTDKDAEDGEQKEYYEAHE